LQVDERVRILDDAGARPGGRYVLYWCRVNRRVKSNHALRFAAARANSLGVPLLVFDSLGCDYPYANDRLHTFVLEGVPEFAAALGRLGIGYGFHLATRRRASHAVLRLVAAQAAAIVTDDYPEALLRHLPAAAEIARGVESHAVDSSCIVPMRSIPERCYAAYSIRPKIGRLLPAFLKAVPPVEAVHRFEGGAPDWQTEVDPRRIARLVAACQIDHSVPPSVAFRGGATEAARHLRRFLRSRLRRYAADKNSPSAHATSDLSPYLHCGHIASLDVALETRAYAAKHKLVADEFLEELIVRRELAFNFAASRPVGQASAQAGPAPREFALDALPDWARRTLDKHRNDARDPTYTREQFEAAATSDGLWNAAQNELLLRGKIHGYYRMYWGKKIVEWSATPEDALATILYLNDRYCLDGQDPSTYAGVLWCLGLHDRPWQERPIFGMVRYMSLAGMERKTDVAGYIREIQSLE
jgi:deoxyribodipyrimidine photo-lyase